MYNAGKFDENTNNKSIGIYVHIPFCKSKCFYCDFNSFAGRDKVAEPYFNALMKEIAFYGAKLQGRPIKTVFIGGGTPSHVKANLISDVIFALKSSFNLQKDAEISMEANPGTLSREKLALYREAGINRLSIGLQAWQNNILESIGRIHSIEEFLTNYKQARDKGFKNINIDLIFGLPHQTISDWRETVDCVAGLSPEHVSCYSLKIEEGTSFGRMLEAGEISQAEDELDREMYYYAIERFAVEGLKHYEISNFARSGFECRHNLIYWRAEEYIGLGAGAHSYIYGERYNNIYDIAGYMESVSKGAFTKENVSTIGLEDRMSEFMILGLRLTEGIDPDEFRIKFNKDILDAYGRQLEKLAERGLVECCEKNIRLTRKGLDLANQVFMEFI